MFKGLVEPDHINLMGQPLLAGAKGGLACYSSRDGNGNGGFGGGGGGCNAGGGGGGFSGNISKSPKTASSNYILK